MRVVCSARQPVAMFAMPAVACRVQQYSPGRWWWWWEGKRWWEVGENMQYRGYARHLGIAGTAVVNQ